MAKFLSKINSPDYAVDRIPKIDSNKDLVPSNITLQGSTSSLLWGDGEVQQRILITDNSTSDDAVFTFGQSTDSGLYFTPLLKIKDTGEIVANEFTGDLNGTASNSKYSQYIKITEMRVNTSKQIRYILLTSNPSTHTNGHLTVSSKIGIIQSSGTTTQIGLDMIRLGNNIIEGNDDNAEGKLQLFTSRTGDDVIQTTPHELTITHTLPAKSGILLNTGNYMDYTLPLTGGTITGNLIVNGTIEGKTTITADTDLITKSGIVNLNDNALIQYNETDECIEFIFN